MDKRKLNFKLFYDLNEDQINIVNNLNTSKVFTNNNEYLVFGFGSIIKFSRAVYLDQLSGNKRIINREFKSYLLQEYNLSEKDYFNIVIFGDINYKRYCKYCGKELSFLGLNRDINRSYRNYCNLKCEFDYRVSTGTSHLLSSNRSKYFSNHDEKCRELGKKLYLSGNHPFNNIENTIKATKENFIKNFKINRNYKIAKFYISTLENLDEYIKIGVTTSILESRTKHIRGDSRKYSTIHLLYEGLIDDVADIEYKVKLKFKNNLSIPNSTEIFNRSILRDILNYTKELINNLHVSQ